MAANISPKQFYSLVQNRPDRAYEFLSKIPLDSRLQYASFLNKEGRVATHREIALHAAARKGHAELVQLLLKSNSDKDARQVDGRTPIFVASEYGHEKVVKILLDAGADKDAPDNDGRTPIWKASFEGRDEVVKLLLAAGADKNAARNDRATPLFAAAFNGHDEVVKRLIAAGADKNAARNDRATPLFAAALNGHDEVVKRLIAAGAEKDAARNDGATPIFVASQEGHGTVVGLLLAAGADMNAAKKDGATPISVASEKGHEMVVEMLLAQKSSTCISSADCLSPHLPQSTIDVVHSHPTESVSQHVESRLSLPQSPPVVEIPEVASPALVAPDPPLQDPPVQFPLLDNLLISPEKLMIESTSFADGADGILYRAQYLGITVAVKKLRNHGASFTKELEKWCQFRHPNILQLLGFSQPSNSLPLIVMELMDQSLFELLNNHRIDLSWESRLKMAHGIAAGLVYLHEIRNIIHRDIKSLNILVKGRDNEVKIADFGASRGSTSLVSHIAGTPRWLAPELYDDRPPTSAVDIYAFGITLNELSTRKPPFFELENNEAAIMKAVTSNLRPKMEPFPSAASIPSWHPLFVELIHQCWDQDPSQRPSASVVLDKLRRMLGLPSTSSPASSPPVERQPSIHYDEYTPGAFTFGVPSSSSSPVAAILSPSTPSTSPPVQPRPSILYDSNDQFAFNVPPSPSSPSSSSSSQIDSTPSLATPSSPSTSSQIPLTSDWTVRSWLSSNGISNEIILLFETNDLDDRDDIRGLSEQDLEKLGISSMGIRKKILRFAQQL